MSFSKTVSVCAALASIFAAGAAGYKLSQDNQSTTPQLEEKVQQLEKQLEETQQPQVVPQPIALPTQTPQVAPQPTQLPPVPPPPAPENVTH
jgi:uncharacterized protein HemX